MPDTPTLEAVPDSPSQEADHPAVSGGKPAERPRLSLVTRTVEFDTTALEAWARVLASVADALGQIGPAVVQFRSELSIPRSAVAAATDVSTSRLQAIESEAEPSAPTISEAAALVAWMLTTAKANQ